MKFIVTHTSPDLDAITSVWLIKKFLPDWADAEVKYIQAGERIQRLVEKRLASSFEKKELNAKRYTLDTIEKINEDDYIHVDTGLGPLDHHQIEDDKVSATSLVWEYIKIVNHESGIMNQGKWELREDAVQRMVSLVTEIDHFQEVFWEKTENDRYEFMLSEIIEGLKLAKPDQDDYYLDFTMKALDAIYHNFENRVNAEKEIKEKGIKFQTSYGEGIGFETLNDSVIKLAQRIGFAIVIRKDPRKGYVRIKARPAKEGKGVDLTLACEQLKKMDPEATWFLHVSRKMLLNGTTKNPNMKPTTLSLNEIIKVLEKI